jgi:hypothetical protein
MYLEIVKDGNTCDNWNPVRRLKLVRKDGP